MGNFKGWRRAGAVVQGHNTGLAFTRSWVQSSALLGQETAETDSTGYTHILQFTLISLTVHHHSNFIFFSTQISNVTSQKLWINQQGTLNIQQWPVKRSLNHKNNSQYHRRVCEGYLRGQLSPATLRMLQKKTRFHYSSLQSQMFLVS